MPRGLWRPIPRLVFLHVATAMRWPPKLLLIRRFPGTPPNADSSESFYFVSAPPLNISVSWLLGLGSLKAKPYLPFVVSFWWWYPVDKSLRALVFLPRFSRMPDFPFAGT